MTLPEWSRYTGIMTDTIRARIVRLGWSVEKALTTPTRSRRIVEVCPFDDDVAAPIVTQPTQLNFYFIFGNVTIGSAA